VRSWAVRAGARGGSPAGGSPARLQTPLWRAIAIFRWASLAYAIVELALQQGQYAHPLGAVGVLAAMAGWTLVTGIAYTDPARRTWPLLAVDVGVTALALLSTAVLQHPQSLALAAMPVTATWVAGPVLACAVAGGPRWGTVTAVVLGLCDLSLRIPQVAREQRATVVNGPVLLLLAGIALGYVSTLAGRAERALQQATEIEAASRERERLARSIHDSVLQVLALVQRRGTELGGEAAEIGRLAGEQEAALRTLIGAGAVSAPAGESDLRALLTPMESASITVVTPAGPVLLPDTAAGETAAAVRAALDNVRRHCGEGARAWLLVDDEGAAVSVTIRDDGPGMPPGRLAQAAAEGRLGVSHAINGRIRELGGTASIESVPGGGTEVRLRIPRVPGPAPAGRGWASSRGQENPVLAGPPAPGQSEPARPGQGQPARPGQQGRFLWGRSRLERIRRAFRGNAW
jgi:signal transduction histidine kinase